MEDKPKNIFGYCRCSTVGQSTLIQEEVLKSRYPKITIRTEKKSGTTRERPVLNLLLDMIQKGDKIVVYKLDRLGRNLKDLLDIVTEIESKGGTLEVLDFNIDTGTSTGRLFLSLLMMFSEYENNLRRERQLEGIKKCKENNGYKGKQPNLERKNSIIKLLKQNVSVIQISKQWNCSRGLVYKIKKESMICSKF